MTILKISKKRLLITIICLLLVIVYSLRVYILGPSIAKIITRAVKNGVGIDITIGSVRGNYLTTLELHEVKTIHRGSGPLSSINLQKGIVHFSLPPLLVSEASFISNLNIFLSKPKLDIDLTILRKGEKSNAGSPLPAYLPSILVEQGIVHLKGHGFQVTTDPFAIDLSSAMTGGDSAKLRIQAPAVLLSRPEKTDVRIALDTTMDYDDERLHVLSLKINNNEIIERFTADLQEAENGIIALEAALTLFEGRGEVAVRMVDNHLEGSLLAEEMQLKKVSSLFDLQDVSPGGRLNLSADFRLETNRLPTIAGTVICDIFDGSFRGTAYEKLHFEAEAKEEEIQISRIDLRTESNAVSFMNVSLPKEKLLHEPLDTLIYGTMGNFSMQLQDIPALLKMAELEKTVAPAKLPAHNLTLEGMIAKGGKFSGHGLLLTETGAAQINSAAIALPPKGMSLGATAIEADLTADIPDLAEISALFQLPSLQGSLAAAAKFNGTFAEPTGFVTLHGNSLAIQGSPLGNLEVSIQSDAHTLQVQSAHLENGDDHLAITGKYSFKTQQLEEVMVNVSVEDLSPYGAKFLDRYDMHGRCSGKALISGDIRKPDVNMELRLADGQAAGFPIQSADLKLNSKDGKVEITHALLQSARIAASATGMLAPLTEDKGYGLDLETFSLSTKNGLFRLAEPTQLIFPQPGSYVVKKLVLTGDDGDIRADGQVDLNGESNIAIDMNNFKGDILRDLFDEQLVLEEADLGAIISGNIQAPVISASGTIGKLGTQDMPFPLSAALDLQLHPEGLSVNKFQWSSANGHNLSIAGFVPFGPWAVDPFLPGTLKLSAEFTAPDLELFKPFLPASYQAEGSGAVTLTMSGTWDKPSGHLRITAEDFGMPSLPAFRLPYPASIIGEIFFTNGQVEIKTVHIEAPGTIIKGQGKVFEISSLKTFLQGKDFKRKGMIDGHIYVDIVDLDWLAAGITALRRLSGKLHADIDLAGPIIDPQITGIISLKEGELHTNTTLPTIQSLNLSARATPDQITLEEVHGEFGASPFTLTGTIQKNDQAGPSLQLHLQGKNLLLFRNENTGLRTDTDLRVEGPLERLRISGNLAVTDGRYTRNYDFLNMFRSQGTPRKEAGIRLFSFRDPPLKDAELQIRLTAKTPFQLSNNLAKATMRPDLMLSGTGELPVLTGVVFVDSGRINLPAGRMRVDSGLVRFTKSSPDVPTLNFTASSRLMNYDITALVEGPYNEPVVTLSSTPPLPEADLLLLVLTGKVPTTGIDDAEAQAKMMTTAAIFVGKEVLAKLINNDSGAMEDSLLDRLDIQIGRNITEKGNETIDANFLIADRVIRNKGSLYITSEKDIFDSYNLGLKIVVRFK